MNTARWVLAHQMQMDRDKRELRRYSQVLGTDLSAFSEEEVDEDQPVKMIPLAALLNPETFSKMVKTYSGGSESFIEDDEYEKQAEALEKAGMMTEIDSIVSEAEDKAKAKKDQTYKDRTDMTLDSNLDFLRDVDELTNKAEQLSQKKRRPRIIR